ncbi:MAG: hypothetical protein U5L11_12450 [Arhodomonas sp.]|nr:hypothetical protein [Arhodomonas sp.]
MARIKALIDGRWHGDIEETPRVLARLGAGDRFRARVTADGGPGPAASRAGRRSPADTTCTSPTPAPGPTGRSSTTG